MIGGLELDGQDLETWINNDLLLKQQQTENRRTRKRRYDVTNPVNNTEARILRPRIDNNHIESQNLNVAADINEQTASRTRPIHSNRLTASRRSNNNSNNNPILRNANLNLTQNSSQAIPAQILTIPSSSTSSSSSSSQGATGAFDTRNEHQIPSSTTATNHSHNNISFSHTSTDPIYPSQSSNWLSHFLLANQTQNLHDNNNQHQQANYSVFHQLQHAVALATTAAAAASNFPSLLSNSTRSTTTNNNNTTPPASELDPWILYNYLLTVGSSNYYQSSPSASADNRHSHHHHHHHNHNSNAQNNAELLQLPNQSDVLHLNPDGSELTNSYWPNPFNPNIRTTVPANPISSERLNQNNSSNQNQNSLLHHEHAPASGADFSNNHYFPVHLTQDQQSSINHRDSGSNHTRNIANSIRSNIFTNRFNYSSMCPYHPMSAGSNNLIYQNGTSVGLGLNAPNPTTTTNQSETNNNRATTNNSSSSNSNASAGVSSNYFYPTTEFYYPFWHITPSFQPIYSINSPNIDTLFHLAAHFEQRKRGISRDELDKMPTYRFKANKNSEDVPKCIVCLDDFEPKQNIRTLYCKHEFHAKCIDKWLKINRTCPSCRADAFDGSAQKDGA